MSAEYARQAAIVEFEGFCRAASLDPTSFVGPELARTQQNGRVFSWVSRSDPRVVVEVWISFYGASSASLEGQALPSEANE